MRNSNEGDIVFGMVIIAKRSWWIILLISRWRNLRAENCAIMFIYVYFAAHTKVG
jgi:hypothetical protein